MVFLLGNMPPAEFFGAWVLVPPIVTIVLAIWLRQVIPALAIGILVAAYMLAWHDTPWQFGDVAVGGITQAVEGFLIGAIAHADHVKILVFTLMIGGMVGIIGANGGTAAIVNSVARWATTRQRGQIATWFAGLIVFFDDYANAMIVGPAMRPICDRLKISREKLAYLVDSTAAPVSSIVLVGTWIGTEVMYIGDGLKGITERPAFLGDTALDSGFAYVAFLQSIQYRFYPILALVMVLIIGVLNRDFGPMRRAEQRLQLPDSDATAAGDASETTTSGKGWYAGVPVLVLVLATLGLLLGTGYQKVAATNVGPPQESPSSAAVVAADVSSAVEDQEPSPTSTACETQAATQPPQQSGKDYAGFELFQQIVSSGSAYNSILYGALAALLVAVGVSLITRSLTIAQTMDSATAVMERMLPTLIVLVLAWALSSAMQTLQLGEVARELLKKADFDVTWLPLAIFVAACIVSFATGTSWGTMGILCPAAVTMSAGLLADVPAEQAFPLFYGSIGGVLAGAIFGDHCSPISDTTVLSALASECSLETHVWTQMPYALTVAGVSIFCGDVLCRQLHQPAWVGLLVGSAALLVIVLAVGRRPCTPTPARISSPHGGCQEEIAE